MMRSMFSGVTGLRNHQVKMDVIGNNIANVNTVGFKKGRATFQDALSQTMRGASSPQGNRGGTNPMQVGLGMTIATIDTIHSPTSVEATGNITDLAVEGDGFFVLSDGKHQYYTRAGNFQFDEEGNFVNTANGLKVVGWQFDLTEEIQNKSPQNVGPIVIQKGMMVPARATDEVKFANNLNDSDVTPTETDPTKDEYYNYIIPFKVYDSKGNEHELNIGFRKSTENTWDYNIYGAPEYNITDGTGTLVFKNDGNYDKDATGGLNQISITVSGADTITFTPDFNKVTQFARETSIDISSRNGYPAGTLKDITIDITGTVSGSFDNGQNRELAQVALANFNNPGGLMKSGQNLYEYSNNSGEPNVGEPGTGGRGSISPGSLEMSNVDLSEEFTQMIITQRGFQANSRIITASDEMLQELVNLKR
ncbi:MAG TPA: flagellar hook protein FlgE [Thermoanaerobacterales bacterium]|nr:flagellar hook protein FlgE [Thermoanaerobacterales bacterium]